MHIYAFGSICRGEVSEQSDVDLLAIVKGFDSRFDPSVYSVYSYERIKEIWLQGNPFAWHLFLESRLVFAVDKIDFLRELGIPSPYKSGESDCLKFYEILKKHGHLLFTMNQV